MVEIKEKEKSSETFINFFENATEFYNFLKNKPHKKGRDNASIEDEPDFAGVELPAALKFLKFGNVEDEKNVLNLQKQMKISDKVGKLQKSIKYENDIIGVVPCVPNYLLGLPKSMIDIKISQKKSRIVNIFVNVRVNSDVSKNSFTKTGSIYLSIIDMLEKRGYNINLYIGVGNYTRDGFHRSLLVVKFKNASELLNLKKVSFPLTNVAFQRRLKFNWMEKNNSDIDWTLRGYGGYLSEDDIQKLLTEKLKIKNALLFDYNFTPSLDDVIEKLKKEGIVIYE